VVDGPYVRCLDHGGVQERETLAAALAAVSQRRACERLRIAWQRHLLAAEPKLAALHGIPRDLTAYLEEQTTLHANRLDHALGDGPPDERSRQRWHAVGWRAAPALAARYQAAGLEAGVAFLAAQRRIEPAGVAAALRDATSPIAHALRQTRRRGYTVQQLDLGQHSLVTDDLPYEPLPPGTTFAARPKPPKPAAARVSPERLVEVATRLVAEHPGRPLSLDAVAAAARTTQVGVSRRMGNLDALLGAVLEHVLADLGDDIPRPDEWRPQVRAWMRGVTDRLLAHPQCIDVLHTAEGPSTAWLRALALLAGILDRTELTGPALAEAVYWVASSTLGWVHTARPRADAGAGAATFEALGPAMARLSALERAALEPLVGDLDATATAGFDVVEERTIAGVDSILVDCEQYL
jgi:AcrR family transcriptional regulator